MGSSLGKFSTIINESVDQTPLVGIYWVCCFCCRDESVEGTVASDGVDTCMAEEEEENISRGVPKGIEGELVAAGWPNWLVAVAGEAINGWLPRRLDTYERIDKIGEGTYSNVYKARDCLFNKIVAMKKVRFDNHDLESVKFMAREIVILRRLGDHPNVIKLEGLVTLKMSCSLYLVFDCMEYDLKGIQEQKGVKFSVPEIKRNINQLLKGLDHCHSHGILHRDVTTSNLLVNKEGILTIADFGLSTFFDPEQSMPLTSQMVTPWYRPPELLLGLNSYGVAVDLWSAGCVLGELFTGKPIMPGKTEFQQLYKIFKLCGSPTDDFWQNSKVPNASIFKPQKPYKRQIQETFHDLPAAAVVLMDTLLFIEPEYRGTAALALHGEFFTTELFACNASSLPQCSPSKEINAKMPLPTASDKMQDLLKEHDSTILKAITRARLEKGSTAKGNDHDSKGKNNHSLGPSTSTNHETTGNDQMSTPLPAKSTNMQGLPREHKAQIRKDAQPVMSDKEKMAEGEGYYNSNVEKNQLIEQLSPESGECNKAESSM
ncbi:probable serine/threonine-protein kinase At1g54610 [Lycium ferocissimum]|uniref:probable serine/threonine-protein kinase At1g54610 n=1 Tax=Lycium ferocissimum TaxID=112874 RepID=UPI002814C6C8|nr:probable serine/threonine-protein kinase At1g54610 [Lycium ferocissimum]